MNTNHPSPLDLISRLDPIREPDLHLTLQAGSGSWNQTIIGWSPIDQLNLAASKPNWPTSLSDFVTRHQAQNHQLIGYISYNAGVSLHGVITSSDLPDVHVAAFSNHVTFADNMMTIHGDSSFGNQLEQILRRNPSKVSGQMSTYSHPLEASMVDSQYLEAFKRCHNYIKAGDIYQINLTHQLRGQTALSDRELFIRLAHQTPQTLLSLIELPTGAVVSASPERFVQIRGGQITTSPIKGTRPRGQTPEADERLRQELQESPKEQAELNMITDLLRNDLGKICRPGSVEVTAERVITGYPTLWHTHTDIQGQLRPELSAIEALINLVPGGSITGCPKRRAIEIITEVETESRGLYTGTIWTLNPQDELESSIMIRTLIQRGNKLSLGVGGGIVFDSETEAEYKETLDKARAFREL